MGIKMNANNPLLSIIVPAYNVEEYIGECLESLLNQSYSNIEIIVIDDGSTDGTSVCINEYLIKNHNIQYIRQENKGLSESRNLGLRVAKGEFITFVDGDDTIDNDTYCTCLTRFGKDWEVIQYPINQRTSINKRYNSQEEVLFGILMEYIHPSVCNKIFRRELLCDKYFNGRFAEDLPFLVEISKNVRTVRSVDRGGYNYRINPHSLTRTKITLPKMKARKASLGLLFEEVDKYPHLLLISIPFRIILSFEIKTFNFRNDEKIDTFQIERKILFEGFGIVLRSIPIIGYRKFIYYLFLLLGIGENFGNSRLEPFFWNLILDK